MLVLFCSLLLTLQAQEQTDPIYHRVELGENLFRISLKYNVTLERLREWNNLSSDEIQVDQRLIVGYEEAETSQEETSLPNREQSVQPLAEYDQMLASIVDQVEALYYETLALESKKGQRKDTALINAIFRRKYAENYLYELQNELNLTQMEAIRDDIGLGVYSSYTHNFRPGVFEGEDLLFQNRANIGLDWRVLSGGFYGRKSKIKQLEIENQINDLLKVKAARNENYIYNYNFLIYAFNKSQMKYINRRLSIINSYLEVASQMYLVRATPWEEIIKLKSTKQALVNIRTNLTNYNKGFDSAYAELDFDRFLDVEELPVLEVIPEKVFSGPSYDSLNQSLLNLEKQKLDIEYLKTRDFSLRTYFRYNMFDAELANIRTFGSVGATFTAPLFRNKRNEELKEKELAVMESDLSRQLTSINNELMNHYYEYEYTLKQYIDFLGRKEVALEKLRKEITKDDLDDPRFTPLDAITAIDELYSIDFELLDLKQKLYLKLLKIYSLLDVDEVSELTEFMEFNNFFDKLAGDRAAYVWSDVLESVQLEYLSKYAVNNDFDRLFVSTYRMTDDQENRLIAQVQREQRSIYRLIGNNEVVKTGESATFYEQVQKAINKGYSGIHLDIEPHTFEDWEENQDRYLANLLTIVKRVQSELGEVQSLSISLPLFYPESFLKELQQHVQEMVFMCYERAEIEFIVDQLREEVQLNQTNLSLALRTEDFADRIKLEEFAKSLINASGINNLVIQDLGSLIKLDQKTILGR